QAGICWSTSSSMPAPTRRRCVAREWSGPPASSSTESSTHLEWTPAMLLLHEVAHLGHAELLTPDPDQSLWFCTEVLGLTVNGTAGDSVYLRTWDDYEHHSLKLTAAASSGIGRTGLRAASAEALARRVAAIEAAGLGIGWQDGDLGIGPTYVFRDPDGH